MNEEVANVSTNKYMLEPGSRVLLADLGLDGARVLLVGGQPADLLGRGPVALDEDEYFALWRALEALFDDPDLPIRIAEALSPEFFDPAIFAALASAHLDEAAGRIARYKKLISPVRLDIKRDDRSLTITFQHPSPSVPASLVTTELLFWVALVRLGTRRRVEPRQVSGPFALPRLDRPNPRTSASDGRLSGRRIADLGWRHPQARWRNPPLSLPREAPMLGT